MIFLPNMMPLSLFLFFSVHFSLAFVGCESHNQFTSVPGAVDRSRKAGGSLGGKLRPGLPLSHRRWRAPQTGQLDLQSTPNPSSFHVAFFLICFTSFYLENIDWEQLSWLLYWLSSCPFKLQSGVRSNTDIESSVLLLSTMEEEAGNNAA